MQFRQHQRQGRQATFSLLAWFAVLLATVALCVNLLLAIAYKLFLPFSHGFPPLFFETNTGLIVLFVLGGCFVELQRLRSGGGPRVAHWMGGRELVSPDQATERRLLNVVDEMAMASGQPLPRVYVLNREDAINAFVAGWGPEDLVLCVTRGALDRLTRAELQGLVAHEFGHIKEGDLPLYMRLLALVWGLSLVHGYGRTLMATDDDGHVNPLAWLVGFVFAIAGWLGWMAGRLLQAAVARQREFLADASAIQFTRAKDGIGHVLRKLWHDQQMLSGRLRHPSADMLAAFLLHDASATAWLASHPPLSERIRRIYGTIMPPLPAPLLHLQAVEPARALRDTMAPTPEGGIAAAPIGAATPDMRASPLTPLGTARPPDEAKVAEQAALSRLRHLSGPTERRLIVLALMMNRDNPREVRLWEQMAEGVYEPSRILADLASLSPHRRVPEFERVLGEIALEALPVRRALVEQARDLLRADGRVTPRERLWWLALRHRVSERQTRQAYVRPTTGQGHELDQLAAHEAGYVASLSAYLSRFVPCDEAEGAAAQASRDWYTGVLQRCGIDVARHPLQAPDADALMHALAGVQELSWMLRPLLMKAWVEEALNHSVQGLLTDNTADALRLAAQLIEAPLPPMLEAHYARP
jgi:Zn-dependent protease with chaperone function